MDQTEKGTVLLTTVLLKKLSGFFAIDDQISLLFREICDDVCEFNPGDIIVRQGGDYSNIYLVDRGWAVRSRYLPNGTRQIVNVGMPGDFLAMNALLFRTSDFELACKTDVVAYRFSADRLGTALANQSVLSSALFWVNAHEESLLAERIVSLGRRTARERTAHILCELISRLEICGVDDISRLFIPLSQTDFADILGISLVHMNKTLRRLESDKIISFRNATLRVLDRQRLEIEAGFDSGYVQFTRRQDAKAWRPERALRA
ncbi:MAG: Crp/Fnr family transcriptional regulator [Pseudomonadota bacterium]